MCRRGSLLFSAADYIWTSFRLWMSISMIHNSWLIISWLIRWFIKFKKVSKSKETSIRFLPSLPNHTRTITWSHSTSGPLLYFRSTSGRFKCTTLSAVVHYYSAALFSVSSTRSICSQIAHGHLRTRLSVQDHGPGNPAHQKNFQWSSSSIVLPLNVPYNHLMAPSETVSTSKSYYFCIKGHVGHGTDTKTSELDRVRDFLITSVSTLPIYIICIITILIQLL